MKKFLLLFALLFGTTAHAGPMANVEYIHAVIKQQWDIEVPYNPSLTNPKVAANMKYLLTAVDVANKILNGSATSDYGNSEYATMAAADTIATNEAVKRLIRRGKFFVTTTPDTSSFSFQISAAGEFMVDWGDGNIEQIVRTDTTNTTYSHTYETPGEYKIGIDGHATEYSTSTTTAAISFASNKNIAEISGSLGAIFSTIGDGRNAAQQPRFYQIFYYCTNLTGSIPEKLFAGLSGTPVSSMFHGTFSECHTLSGAIPEKLFAGISGAPASNMFYGTFSECHKLSGAIPEKLFAGISGAPAPSMFKYTFSNCHNLSGTIPENLFTGISGTPATYMFQNTFSGCDKLSGTIPENLFAGISGAPASGMFFNTFHGCSNLSGKIPANLFGNISGTPASSMFVRTFSGCAGLSGPSARINGMPLYEIWPSATTAQVGSCYNGATGLSDYESIPANWK